MLGSLARRNQRQCWSPFTKNQTYVKATDQTMSVFVIIWPLLLIFLQKKILSLCQADMYDTVPRLVPAQVRCLFASGLTLLPHLCGNGPPMVTPASVPTNAPPAREAAACTASGGRANRAHGCTCKVARVSAAAVREGEPAP